MIYDFSVQNTFFQVQLVLKEEWIQRDLLEI